MKVSDIVAFLEAAGCNHIKPSHSWVKATCPLAPFTHSGGTDRRPSFGVSIHENDQSKAHCLTCGYKGSLLPMAWKLRRPDLFKLALKDNLPNIDDFVPKDDLQARAQSLPKYWGSANKPSPKKAVAPVNTVLDESLLDQFKDMPDNIRKYLRDRGMLDKTIDKWELGYSKQQRRISIPIRNEGGELVAISGRAYGSHQPKYLHSKFHRNVVLYGEHLIEPGKECYLVEGFFQALAIDQAGYPNALARMGTHLSKWQKQKIDRCFNKLVIVPDGDDAGMESAHKIYQEMKDTMPCQIVDMPPGKDADSLELGQLHEVLKGKKNFLDSPRVVP